MDATLNKTLTQLENQDWGEPQYRSSLVITCHQLRHKPLKDFTAEDLRIMIGQGISLPYLLPLALKLLRDDPLAAGRYYKGDLLINVLTVACDFYQAHPRLREDVAKIIPAAYTALASHEDIDPQTLSTQLDAAQRQFNACR